MELSEVDGWVAPGWDAVRDGFAERQRADRGYAQLAVYHRGRPVADLWTSMEPGRDGVGVVMSVSKGLVATCAHMLVQQGRLDPAQPVAAYWPEFGAHGKQDVTVAHVLSHRAGLPAFDTREATPASRLLDWDEAVKRLAEQAPAWPPGSRFLYHPMTFGHLAGEVIRRITGLSVGEFFHREVAVPLGLSLWIGMPGEAEPRFVRQFSDAPAATEEQVRQRLSAGGVDPDTTPLGATLLAMAREATEFTELFNTPEGRRAQVPAANGVGDARSLARFYAALIGEVDGVRLLPGTAIAAAAAPQTDGVPAPGALATLDGPDRSRFGLGFELPRPGLPMLGPACFGHAGAGGRLAFADPDTGLAVAYLCANMAWDSTAGPDPRWAGWTRALREILTSQG